MNSSYFKGGAMYDDPFHSRGVCSQDPGYNYYWAINSDVAIVHFTTDYSVTYAGFQMTFRSIDTGKYADECVRMHGLDFNLPYI